MAGQETAPAAPLSLAPASGDAAGDDAQPLGPTAPQLGPVTPIGPSAAGVTEPARSTMTLRVARRPWLLEKLTGQRPKPSIKMTPPRPPAVNAYPSTPPALMASPALPTATDGAASLNDTESNAISSQPIVKPVPLKATSSSGASPSPEPTAATQAPALRTEPATTVAPTKTQPPTPAADDDGWFVRRGSDSIVTSTPNTPSTDANHGSDSDSRSSATRALSGPSPESSAPSLSAPQSSDMPSSLMKPNFADLGSGTAGNPASVGDLPGHQLPETTESADASPLVDPQNVDPQNIDASTNDPQDDGETRDRTPMHSPTLKPVPKSPQPLTDPPAKATLRSSNPQSADETADSKRAQDERSNVARPSTDTSKATSAANPGRTKDDSDIAEIILRDLRIAPDGSPNEAARPTRDRRVSEQPLKDPAPARGVAEARIESDPPEIDNVAPEPAAQIRYDYAGYPMDSLSLNNSVRRMQRTMRSCLQYYYARPEIANQRSNWGMLHSIMVFGADTRVIVGRKNYSAIAWIAGNNACRGQRLLTDEAGTISARSGVGLQGHQAQMLAVFALCDVPSDYPLYADKKKFAVKDVIEAEKAACERGAELTFTLIGLSHYLDTDSTWVASDGQHWDFERLIREELSQPIVGAACGGTHRLMGFGHALRKRRMEGKPITGQWKRAERFTQDFQTYCYRLQNRDGSMSTDWFEGREDNENLDRKIQTTGHMVEWLLTITPDSELQNPRLVSAVRFLLNAMYGERSREWSIGPKGHALRSLAMYYERAYRSGPGWTSYGVAQNSSRSKR